tara:strand:- start:80 stop:442 length:363 start_codon:yes stop_codon:yes gene_type:complete
MNDNGCWTEHYNYERISALTDLGMGDYGKVSKTSAKSIQRQVDELMLEAFLDGYSLDGGEISYKDYVEALKNGWRPEYPFQQCYYVVVVDKKVFDWHDLSDTQRKVLIDSGEYFDMDKIW